MTERLTSHLQPDSPVGTRRLGANGPLVSAIGLGCMGMSDFYAKD